MSRRLLLTLQMSVLVASVVYKLGQPGKNCLETCESCDNSVLASLITLTSVTHGFQEAAHTCTAYNTDCMNMFPPQGACGIWGAPFVHKDAQANCQWGQIVAPCDHVPSDSSHQRLCPCAVAPGPTPNGSPGGDASGGRSLDWAGVFLIIFFVVVFVYIALGCALNIRKGTRGLSAFPHLAFWGSAYGLVKDGCCFVWRKLRGFGRKVDYDHVPE